MCPIWSKGFKIDFQTGNGIIQRGKEENELGKSLAWIAGVGFKVVEKIKGKTTRVEKKGEKSERKREKRGPGRTFAGLLPLNKICINS